MWRRRICKIVGFGFVIKTTLLQLIGTKLHDTIPLSGETSERQRPVKRRRGGHGESLPKSESKWYWVSSLTPELHRPLQSQSTPICFPPKTGWAFWPFIFFFFSNVVACSCSNCITIYQIIIIGFACIPIIVVALTHLGWQIFYASIIIVFLLIHWVCHCNLYLHRSL